MKKSLITIYQLCKAFPSFISVFGEEIVESRAMSSSWASDPMEVDKMRILILYTLPYRLGCPEARVVERILTAVEETFIGQWLQHGVN